MGLGTRNIINVKNDENGIMSIQDLEMKIEFCKREKLCGRQIAIIHVSFETFKQF